MFTPCIRTGSPVRQCRGRTAGSETLLDLWPHQGRVVVQSIPLHTEEVHVGADAGRRPKAGKRLFRCRRRRDTSGRHLGAAYCDSSPKVRGIGSDRDSTTLEAAPSAPSARAARKGPRPDDRNGALRSIGRWRRRLTDHAPRGHGTSRRHGHLHRHASRRATSPCLVARHR